MKKLLALLLALCMMLSLAACAGNGDSDDDNTKKHKVIKEQEDEDEEDPDENKDEDPDADQDEDPDEDEDEDDPLREGLNAYEFCGLRYYLGNEIDVVEYGYAVNDDMKITLSYIHADELEVVFGEPVSSASDYLDISLDLVLDEGIEDVLDRGKQNGIDFGHVTSENGYIVCGIYYENGYFWYMTVYFEDESLAETAIKYATICEIVGMPDEDYDEDYDEDFQAPNPGDVMATFENSEVVLMICGFEKHAYLGSITQVYVENKSNKDLTLVIYSAVADGLTADASFYLDLEAGEACYDEVYLDAGSSDVEYSWISLDFTIREEGNYSDDPTETTLTYYPCGPSAAEDYVREPQASDKVLLDNQYVTVYLLSEEETDMFGYQAQLYLVNKTTLDLTFNFEAATVNGSPIRAYLSSDLLSDTCCFMELNLYTDEFDNVYNVEEAILPIEARIVDDWFGDSVFEDVITIIH